MVKGDGSDCAEAAEIVFVGIVEAVPCYYIEWGVILSSSEQMTVELGEYGVRSCAVFFERCNRSLEVSSICKVVGSNWAEFGELEVTLVELEDVASDGAFGQRDIVSDTSWDHADLIWSNEDVTELCLDVQHSVLCHYQKVPICRIESLLFVHALASSEDKDSNSRLHGWVSSSRYQLQAMHPVYRLI